MSLSISLSVFKLLFQLVEYNETLRDFTKPNDESSCLLSFAPDPQNERSERLYFYSAPHSVEEL